MRFEECLNEGGKDSDGEGDAGSASYGAGNVRFPLDNPGAKAPAEARPAEQDREPERAREGMEAEVFGEETEQELEKREAEELSKEQERSEPQAGDDPRIARKESSFSSHGATLSIRPMTASRNGLRTRNRESLIAFAIRSLLFSRSIRVRVCRADRS